MYCRKGRNGYRYIADSAIYLQCRGVMDGFRCIVDGAGMFTVVL